jgi:hypothetical protein
VNAIEPTTNGARSAAASGVLPICVVATTIAATREAIATAAALAQPIHARVHVIAARPAPPEWPLERQSAPVHALATELRRAIEHAPGHIDILPCVCRQLTDVTQLVPHGALVIVAGPSNRWWPTREQKLAHDLNGLGHRVLFIHTSGDAADTPEA